LGDKAIVTVCLKGFPGANRALVELDRTTGLTRHVALASTNPRSPEILFLAALLRERRPRAVVFGAWSPVYEAIVEAASGLGIRFGVYWTSSGGQTDMSDEVPKLARVIADPAIERLLFCEPGLAEAFRRAGLPAAHLPLTLSAPGAPPPDPPFAVDGMRISLFCPPAEYRRKNVVNCLVALAAVTSSFTLLLNGLSENASYRRLLETLRLPYEDLGWMERPDYEASLSAVDLGLQLSFAESYNYVAAEHLIRGVPVLTSPMVPVVRSLGDETRRRLIVEAADDPAAIGDRIQAFVDDPAGTAVVGRRARDELTRANERSVVAARSLLRALADEP
jgi:glycosyltransferase involved in cell wall biosynthesis